MSGGDIITARILTFPKVRTPAFGEGIGSTRGFIFSRNIMYVETRTVYEYLTTICVGAYVRTVKLSR